MVVARSAAEADSKSAALRGPGAVVRGVGGEGLGRETMQPLWDFLEADRTAPFFVWYAPMLPHVPFDAPERFTRLYADDPRRLRGYRANVTRFDATVGELLARLDALGLRDETLIAFANDNGGTRGPAATRSGSVARAARARCTSSGAGRRSSCRGRVSSRPADATTGSCRCSTSSRRCSISRALRSRRTAA